ncbi:hypothetical protein FJT64_004621 [Amphibalanus amphitrite]|uniref:Uncharacterized protein n=1 Tax=Amphibalanus amphitrite TaxID=1232801 RepID=A0A6A4W4T4_AMPAM|nr:hypothetical protein FJT64_004621 [Amphibalanus amphitrite]
MNSYMAFFAAMVALSMFSSCSGLQCYECTTKNHTACEYELDPARAKAAGFIKTCPEPKEKGMRALCRTTHQTVLEEVRIIRGCGFANDTKECSGSRNSEVIVNSCQCFTDLCNSVGVTQLAPAALLAAFVLRAALH